MKVIISGGGTGGHIYPAIAIANALKTKVCNIDILFIGAKGRMEMEKIPEAGYNIKGLWISGLQRRLTFKNLLFPFKVILSLIKARSIINDFKPDVVIGVGGYASGPTLRAATSKKIPALIQEQNSYPGITNKILSVKVNKICVAYPHMERFFPAEKLILTGNPVRQGIVNNNTDKSEAALFFNLNINKKTILVIGGSLGARTINESIMSMLSFFHESDCQLVWQTGKNFYETAKNEVDKMNYQNVRVFGFINKMENAYSIADIIISRAGAIAISELCIVGKPCILIPSPNVAEDHQTKNAMALVTNNAALLVKDSEARSELKNSLFQLIENDDEMNRLSENIRKFAYPDAAEKIANEIISLIKK